MGPAPLVLLYIFGLRQAEVGDRKSRLYIGALMPHMEKSREIMSILLILQKEL